jgi:hypothetical protein
VNTALGLVMHEERADDGESVAEGLTVAFPLKPHAEEWCALSSYYSIGRRRRRVRRARKMRRRGEGRENAGGGPKRRGRREDAGRKWR